MALGTGNFNRAGTSQIKAEEESSIQAVYPRDNLLVITWEDEEGTVKAARYRVRLHG